MDLKRLGQQAKSLIDKRGGSESVKEDASELQRQGVAAVFTPGAPTSEIVDFLKGKVPA